MSNPPVRHSCTSAESVSEPFHTYLFEIETLAGEEEDDDSYPNDEGCPNPRQQDDSDFVPSELYSIWIHECSASGLFSTGWIRPGHYRDNLFSGRGLVFHWTRSVRSSGRQI